MHDGQVEDRIRAVLRAEGDALPLTITTEELERRLAVRRRERLGGRAGLLAAGLAVVAIGSIVATSGGWFRAAPVGNLPDGSSAPTTRTSSPSEAALPCTTIEPDAADQPPTINLGATPGDSIAYGGALGAYQIGSRADGVEGSWLSVDAEALKPIHGGPPTERLEVIANNPDACLIGVTVDAVPFGQVGPPVLPVAGLAMSAARVIEFALPPSGDWLVRVHADFATASGVEAWSETYFRVVVPDATAGATELPGVLPDLEPPPGTILVDFMNDADPPFAATGDTGERMAGEAAPRSQYRVDFVCLGSVPAHWAIGFEGGLAFLAAGDQVCNGTPGTYVIERGLPTTSLPVIVGGDARTAWHIVVSTVRGEPAFIPPVLRMIETGNTEGAVGAAEAYGRCVSTAEGSDPCAGEWSVLDGASQVRIPTGSRLTFGLADGWLIDEARVTAAVTDQVRANAIVTEYSVGFTETGSLQVTLPIDLGRGSWILRISLNATRGEATFGAHYDLPLIVGD